LILVMAVLGLAGALPAIAQEATPPPEPAATCGDCHIDIVASWQDSPHALASTNADFLQYWLEQDQDPTCRTCHSTGFTPRTGEYEHEGVACTACHGETPTNHPPEPVAVDPGTSVCESCHETTFTEWQSSAHGEQQLACTTCHAPHPQTLRFETADALCLNCHTEDRDDFAHVTHVEQQCVDCHWYHNDGMHEATGHDNVVETSTCIDCHAKEQPISLASGDTVLPLREAHVRISELETQIQSTRAEADNSAALQTVYGVILGAVAVAGIGIIAGLARRRKPQAETKDNE
jgi:predicted CXXCH cytochrome family protein